MFVCLLPICIGSYFSDFWYQARLLLTRSVRTFDVNYSPVRNASILASFKQLETGVRKRSIKRCTRTSKRFESVTFRSRISLRFYCNNPRVDRIILLRFISVWLDRLLARNFDVKPRNGNELNLRVYSHSALNVLNWLSRFSKKMWTKWYFHVFFAFPSNQPLNFSEFACVIYIVI